MRESADQLMTRRKENVLVVNNLPQYVNFFDVTHLPAIECGYEQYLKETCGYIQKRGLCAEFGVFTGNSLRILSETTNRSWFGFDSFEGLPEAWEGPQGHVQSAKGAFACNPPSISNVTLITGWFENTLPQFVEEHAGEVFDCVHIDCDLYSSTRTIFTAAKSMFVSGTVILFDEFYGYYGWEKHEFKAFCEFLSTTGFEVEYLFRHEPNQLSVILV